MKKLFAGILCAAVCGAAMFGAAACGDESEKLTIYAPDGAPALALTSLISGEGADSAFDVHIVDANSIQTYVTANAETKQADFCILPVNAAANLLGNGENYQMLGTVTHGNLYFLKDTSKNLPDLTPENVTEVLPGKMLGVIQYENVPGLTLRAVLNDKGIAFQQVESVKNPAADKVNLLPCTPSTAVPATGCDYYLCPEPAATTKVGASQGLLAPAGSLQQLYGEGGYPQAALVAKKSVIEGSKEAVDKVIGYMEGAADFLKNADAATLNSLLSDKRTAGMDAAFTEAQLNPTVVANCSVRFTAAKDCKSEVVAFLMKFKTVAAATAIPADAFFYAG